MISFPIQTQTQPIINEIARPNYLLFDKKLNDTYQRLL